MKKGIFTICVILVSMTMVFAQNTELKSKKGVPILPEAGEYSLAVDAVPFLCYFGDAFNGTVGNTAPIFSSPQGMTIIGKKMIDANKAYRVMFRLGMTTLTDKNEVGKDLSTTDFVTDKMTNGETNIMLGVGIENRRGKGRVQGVYGYQAFINLEMASTKYTYGNSLTGTALSTDWTTTPPSATLMTSRLTKNKQGMVFGLGAEVFAGVEYFFAPKMSLGGEFGFGLMVEMEGKDKVETESWNGTSSSTTEVENGGAFGIGIDNVITGKITLSFYF